MPYLAILGTRRALLLVAAGLYAPLVVLGYGSDYDSYGVLRAGRLLVESGFTAYDHSRNPGYFLHELATGLLDAVGGSVLANMGTLTMALVAIGCFYAVLGRLKVPNQAWLTVGLMVQPYFWINAASTMDYVWSLGFLMAGWLAVLDRRWLWSGLLFGLAIGSRLSAILVAVAILGQVVLSYPDGRQGALRALLVTLGIGVLLYVPPALVVGSVGGLFQPAMDGGDWSWSMRGGRFLYKNATLWGVPAATLGLVLVGWGRIRRSSPERHGLMTLCVLVIVLVEALYLKYPLERAYVLPAVPFMLIGLGLLVPRRSWLIGFVALTALHAFVRIDVARPDVPNGASRAEFGLWIGEGVLVEDLRQRWRLRHCESTDCWYQTMGVARPAQEGDRP